MTIAEIEKMPQSGRPATPTGDQSPSRPGLPPTEQLLLAGGDARIALVPERATNRYGCPPLPDPDLLAFGSSTASVISDAAFAAADRQRQRLLRTTTTLSHADAYARELKRIRQELTRLCGVADIPGLDIVFAASGTDLHLISAQLAGGAESAPTRIIMVDPEETGRGVPTALASRHFSTHAALGEPVTEGTSLAGGSAVEVVTVPVRLSDGSPRPATAIDAEVEALANDAIAQQRRVLLIVVDTSKTGMIAPSPACAAALRRRLPASVDVLVDACQFRIAPATLRAYLRQDFMVALTGSKFLTGPTFSGALLIPSRVAGYLRKRPLPRALSAYSSRSDWPSSWPAAEVLDKLPNFGMLLRWEAALEELRAFRAVPEEKAARFLQAFAMAVRHRLSTDPRLEPLPTPHLDRAPIAATSGWDSIPTIFPFLLFDPAGPAGKRPLNREQTMQVYRLLQADLTGYPELANAGIDPAIVTLRCQLGQPVMCGERAGIPVSALRVCSSARLIVEAARDDGRAVIERALAVLDKAAMLIPLGR